ncbi:MAG: arsenate reductase (thioredoxin) [Bacteroidetes bacterium]|nr:arsenate reductase (thioredoxin) [Rhodothermia bacterium]MCS7155885.1 arsenate reductase (thioredoxin) [Bacteroidota bacterium]MCX7906014.1 arsenate reductase (thioredoxin) [Bacteroidota bacterium]MDW8138142.1 arsenate reductase (thioredoxin) [Bacteroidota bacterium]MDW8285826.1 arsenate reductase (thioredoxin) [Bacteroidota bacterium]
MNRPLRVLVLCTGNSCRSQMAEGWLRHLGCDRLEVQSAGIEAHGLHPYAVRVMAEAGVDISRQRSKVCRPEMFRWADCVITVCGHADEHCPVLPEGVRKLHWPFEDPARAVGTEDEVLAVFRRVRDAIRAQAEAFVQSLPTGT